MVKLCKIWTKDDIREVLNEISAKMGLDCSDIEIKISKSKNKMGELVTTVSVPGNEVISREFRFSKYLLDGRFTEEAVIDSIGHEYIHFYTNVTTNNHTVGHNKDFYANCKKAGVIPERIMSEGVIDKSLDFNPFKYEIVCLRCNRVIGHRYRISDIKEFEANKVCRKCKSNVKVVQLH